MLWYQRDDPSRKESAQISQTRAGLVRSNLRIGIWCPVHCLQSRRPQWRLCVCVCVCVHVGVCGVHVGVCVWECVSVHDKQRNQ